MKHRSSETGLAHLGAILLVAAVIAAAALAGWYVWQKNKQPNRTAATSSPHTSSSTEPTKKEGKTFNCRDAFTLTYPATLQVSITSADQCLVSNVKTEDMPSIGPLPPEQLGLFFNTEATEAITSKEYLRLYIERSQQDYPLELKAQEELELNNGKVATLATMYGGHPVQHEFIFFVHIKDGTAVTTSYPANSDHKDIALEILKTIQ